MRFDAAHDQRLGVVDTATYEAPGAAASVSLTLHGYHVAQRITLGTAMKIDRIMVEAAKVGNPGDALECRIYSDNAGVINQAGQLTAGTLAASNITALLGGAVGAALDVAMMNVIGKHAQQEFPAV